jgi:hypothetical protein
MTSLSALPLFLSIVLAAPTFASIPEARSVPPPSVQVDAAQGQAVRAYPNPWRADRHAGYFIKFDHLPGDATIKIFSVAAQHVKTLPAHGADAVEWDLTNDQGATVASGLYLYLISSDAGGRIAGKLAVIR